MGTDIDNIPSLKLADTLSPSKCSPRLKDLLNEDCFNSLVIHLPPLSSSPCLSPDIVIRNNQNIFFVLDEIIDAEFEEI